VRLTYEEGRALLRDMGNAVPQQLSPFGPPWPTTTDFRLMAHPHFADCRVRRKQPGHQKFPASRLSHSIAKCPAEKEGFIAEISEEAKAFSGISSSNFKLQRQGIRSGRSAPCGASASPGTWRIYKNTPFSCPRCWVACGWWRFIPPPGVWMSDPLYARKRAWAVKWLCYILLIRRFIQSRIGKGAIPIPGTSVTVTLSGLGRVGQRSQG